MKQLLTTVAVILLPATCIAAEWPQWRGPQRDCYVDSATTWPESLEGKALTQQWKIPLGPGYSGPVTHGDRIFVTETRDEKEEVIHAVDRSTGDVLWRAAWPGAMKVPFFARANGSWIRSTPACDGRSLFVAGIRDVLVSLDVVTGKVNWRVDLVQTFDASLPGFGTVCSPIVDGDAIYLQAAASVVKLSTSDGRVLWRSTPESGGLFGSSMGASVFSSPVIATVAGQRQLIVQSRKALSGIDLATGETLWSTSVEAFRGMNILTPMVIGDSIFTSTYGGGSYLFDVTRTGNQFQVTQRWRTKKQGYMSSPVLVDGKLYLHLRNQRFSCVDPSSGETSWTTRPYGKYWSIAANGDRLLALDQRGSLHLIAADPTEYRELSTRQISETETWAHLAVIDSQILIRELDGLTAWNWTSADSNTTALAGQN